MPVLIVGLEPTSHVPKTCTLSITPYEQVGLVGIEPIIARLSDGILNR